ncbi:MAG: DUF1566 domain-containing protein [Myxococcales bacterium]|nr:DUF1566 domain-containing protein [Myxococcales bacterium]
MQFLSSTIPVAAMAVVVTWMPGAPRADAPAGRYTATAVGSTPAVKDNLTGLTWMRNELSGTGFTWANANTACTGGWRLPNVVELKGIVDDVRTTAPTIDTTFFQGQTVGSTPTSGAMWSSSAYALVSGSAWAVVFNVGYVTTYTTIAGNTYGVRCVR